MDTKLPELNHILEDSDSISTMSFEVSDVLASVHELDSAALTILGDHFEGASSKQREEQMFPYLMVVASVWLGSVLTDGADDLSNTHLFCHRLLSEAQTNLLAAQQRLQ